MAKPGQFHAKYNSDYYRRELFYSNVSTFGWVFPVLSQTDALQGASVLHMAMERFRGYSLTFVPFLHSLDYNHRNIY